MSKLTRIIAVVVDTQKAVFYTQSGETVQILQGDSRLRPILEAATPLLSTQRYADVDFSTENSWQHFEEKSNGFRFFKIAKETLKGLFTGSSTNDPIPPSVYGLLPENRNMTAVEEIMKHATSVKSPGFVENTVAMQRPTVERDGSTPNDRRSNTGSDAHFDKHKDTIVAVTPTGKIIPGVERIKSQFTAAVSSGNVRGLEVFMTRIGKVISKRSHTVDDLLRFMERGDMHVADDGSIIIFKRLVRSGAGYVDAHSRNVTQKVGSYVFMDEKLVDPSRRNECSNGLHVARRGYIKDFSGDVVVMAKVHPEAVIAVPDYDANKMRVCGYHIVAELTPAQFKVICNNRPISDAEGGSELMADVITGNHVGVLEYVEIGSALGGNLKITPVVEPKPETAKARKAKKKTIKKKAKRAKTKPVKALEASIRHNDTHVNIKQLDAKSRDSKVSLTPVERPMITQKDIVTDMWEKALAGNKKQAKELIEFKKKAKKGWGTWDLPTSAGDTLKALVE